MTSFHSQDAMHVTNITLNVKDLSRMTHFYSEILGFSIKLKSKEDTIFNVGEHGHTLTLHQLEQGRQPEFREDGLFHIAYLLPTRQDLANFLYHMSRLNQPVGGGDHLVSEALYFNDPEGNGIEVYQDRPSSNWDWDNGFIQMDTLEVDANDLISHRTESGWQGFPANGKIGHLHLKTHDLNEARQFYINQLGFEHISKFPQSLFISTQHYHHHIALNTWQSNKVNPNITTTYGLTHIDIYQPNAKITNLTSPEGFSITVHGDISVVPN